MAVTPDIAVAPQIRSDVRNVEMIFMI